MSEYQYYEFQAIDRPLTDKQMSELRSYSTRARITRTSFINDYSWGQFKGNEDAWMEKYFDVFIYVANWGTQVLKLRLSSRLLDLETAREYCVGDSAYAWESGGNTIVSFVSEEEGEWDWVEGDGIISPVLPVRAELARGDLRALYIGWLLCVQHGELDDEDTESAVPPGLGQLSEPLESLVSFLRIDEHLLHAAAQASAEVDETQPSHDGARAWVAGLSVAEKDDMLAKLIVDQDPALAAELLQRFRKDREDTGHGLEKPAPRRTVGELLQAAQAQQERWRQAKARERAEEAARRQREAAAARAKRLDEIAGRQPQLWARIDRLIAETQPKSYDEAVKLLIDLRDLAQREGTDRQFRMRLEAVRLAHTRKPSFIKRLDKAQL